MQSRGVIVVGMAVVAASCSIGGGQTVADAVAVVDDAATELTTQSADAGTVLADLLTAIEDDESALAEQVEIVADRTAMVSRQSEPCVSDAVRSRAAQDLMHIRDELAGADDWDRYQPTAPPRHPLVCATTAETIDIETVPPEVAFFGYDLDTPTVVAFVEDSAGSRRPVTDGLLTSADHGERVMALGDDGVSLGYDDRRIVLTDDDEVLAELAILIPMCATSVVETESGSLLIEPGFTDQGDPAWQSDPDIDYSAEVTFSETEVKIVGRIQARESRAGPGVAATGAAGSDSAVLYTAEPGFEIAGVRGGLTDEGTYVDGDTSVDELPGSGPISSYEIDGQTPGTDIGNGMQAVVHYNSLQVEIVQAENCAR
ncbi:MAG: hypothetical protein ACR2QK_04395 [Acidimicrobiales bacterium]